MKPRNAPTINEKEEPLVDLPALAEATKQAITHLAQVLSDREAFQKRKTTMDLPPAT